VPTASATLRTIIETDESAILSDWLAQMRSAQSASGRVKDDELATQARDVLALLRDAILRGPDIGDIRAPAFAPLRETLSDLSRSRALRSFTPSETATFVLSLKQPLLARLGSAVRDPADLQREMWTVTELIDKLALLTTDIFQKSREEVILRQQSELAELSTPVVRLWKGVLALPLIGTLDSERTQVVMENLLRSLVETGAEIAIIDITGVPTVDTQVAQHLLKTIAAARLMGADCIISGIRPQIAQTMVHLGVELNVVSKATLADAFAIALDRMGKAVVSTRAKA